jgi:predicted ribosomally synthesized peptide with nif11-like leader
MGESSVADLQERLRTDDEFRARVLAAEHPEARLDVIRAEGYECTAEDIAEYAAVMPDEALAGMSAGWIGQSGQGSTPAGLPLDAGSKGGVGHYNL